jgi:glycerophosphoryl diester phosphodiesterase
LIAQTGSRILVHGHRGARAIYPENTIPAFTYAIETGADALEMDLAVTQDNVLVVSHDPYINPEICTGPHPGTSIRRLTLAELREYDCGALMNPQFPRQRTVPGARIPTLEEVLGLASRGKFKFDIEIKSFPEQPELSPTPEVFARLLLEEIRRHHLETRVVVQSFDFRVLQAMKRLAPQIRLAALWEGDARPFDAIARVAEADIISPEFKLVTAGQVRAAHAHKLDVVPWTANTAEDWQRLIDAGVDGIITDDPASLITYLKENGLRPA